MTYRSVKIEYNPENGTYNTGGDLNDKGMYEVIAAFLTTQMGKGADTREHAARELYKIELQWYPENDSFTVRDDIGNNGLRDGILIDVLGGLGKKLLAA